MAGPADVPLGDVAPGDVAPRDPEGVGVEGVGVEGVVLGDAAVGEVVGVSVAAPHSRPRERALTQAWAAPRMVATRWSASARSAALMLSVTWVRQKSGRSLTAMSVVSMGRDSEIGPRSEDRP